MSKRDEFVKLLDRYVTLHFNYCSDEFRTDAQKVGTTYAEVTEARAAVLAAYDAASQPVAGEADGLCKSSESSTSNLCNSDDSSTQSELTWTKALLAGALAEIAVLKAAPEVAPPDEFNKAGGDLVADELLQGAYSWFREGWYARHKYTHPAPKADEEQIVGWQSCGDCDPCIGGRPDQCAVGRIPIGPEPKPDAAADVLFQAIYFHRIGGGEDVLIIPADDSPTKHVEANLIGRIVPLAASPARPEGAEKCVWTWNDDGFYDTECGGAWSFSHGGPAENNTKFCPYCGKHLFDAAMSASKGAT